MIDSGFVNGNALSASYNHLTSFAVSAGQHVEQGQLIGRPATPARRPPATCTSRST